MKIARIAGHRTSRHRSSGLENPAETLSLLKSLLRDSMISDLKDYTHLFAKGVRRKFF